MTQTATMLEAIAQAMMSEKRAADFYRDAADKAKSPRGKNMLQQLADFEVGHYEALAKLRQSLEGGGEPEVDYPGRAFEPVPVRHTLIVSASPQVVTTKSVFGSSERMSRLSGPAPVLRVVVPCSRSTFTLSAPPPVSIVVSTNCWSPPASR